MMKLITAYTYELNNHEKARQDIHSQLDLKNNLLKNSAALIFCHAKFNETGVSNTVSESLPFAAVGCTSQNFALSSGPGVPAVTGEILLAVTVFTSDDIEFAAALSDPLCGGNAEDAVQSMYKNAVSSFGESSLIFAFFPTMADMTSDILADALYRVCGETPVFGSVALDMEITTRNPATLFNGHSYNDRAALLLVKGSIKPKFFSFLFPGKSVVTEDIIITAASGNRITAINNKSAVSFIESLGLLKDGNFTPAIPLIVENPGGAGSMPVIIYGIDGETLVCSRKIQVGGSVGVGMVSRDKVAETMDALIRDIKQEQSGENLFIVSCALRFLALEGSPATELDSLQQNLKDFPGRYLYISSAGEICPSLMPSGKTINGLHQYALVAVKL